MQKVTVLLVTLSLVAMRASASVEGYTAAAKIMLDGMNQSADPCNDFYNYACGNWKGKHNTADDFDPMTIMYIKILDSLGIALPKLDPVDNPDVRFPFDQAGVLYRACMNGGDFPDHGYDDLMALMMYMDELGGWPTLRPDYDRQLPGGASAVNGLMTGLANIGPFFQTQVLENLITPTKNSLMFQGQNMQTDPDTNQPYVPSEEAVSEYYMLLVTKLSVLKKVKLDYDQALRDAAKIANLYVMSVNATWAANNWQGPPTDQNAYFNMMAGWFNPFTVTTAIQRWPHINWPQIMLNIAYDNTDLINMFGVEFYVSWPSYMDMFDAMMANEGDRTMRNFAFFQFAVALAPTNPTMRADYLASGMAPQKHPKTKSRPTPSGICAEKLMGLIPLLMGRVYADQSSLTRADIDELNEMIGLVLASWRGMITEVPWMSDQSKQNAFAKIDMVARNVAWPAWIMNDRALAEHMRQLNVSWNDDPFTAMIRGQRWSAWQQFSTLGLPYDRYAFGQSPAIVNAWYSPWANSITFPGAIMTAPMFNGSYPKSYNYGHIGWVMGHELGHGFDNNGVYFGPTGGFVNTSWIDPTSKAGFDKMAECVVEEYSQFCFTFPDQKICVNGNQTLPENIADNGGNLASLRALTALLQLQGGEPAMPAGFGPISSMTPTQLFFMSAASTWCSNYPEALIVDLIQNDVHSPDQYRVIGTLRNLPQFASAFNCKVGQDYMAPATHCHVWTK